MLTSELLAGIRDRLGDLNRETENALAAVGEGGSFSQPIFAIEGEEQLGGIIAWLVKEQRWDNFKRLVAICPALRTDFIQVFVATAQDQSLDKKLTSENAVLRLLSPDFRTRFPTGLLDLVQFDTDVPRMNGVLLGAIIIALAEKARSQPGAAARMFMPREDLWEAFKVMVAEQEKQQKAMRHRGRFRHVSNSSVLR